jgi:glycosyltransferase involved in cell wall biosynthesis
MLVSIIIPTFNRLKFLQRAIASIEAQSYQNYEIIIVDDASTDETQAYLQKSKHKSVHLSENRGVSYARNRGLALAQGTLISFLDSDDQWHEDKLLHQVSFHQEHPEVRCSFGIEKWFRNNKPIQRPLKYEAPSKVTFEQLLEFTYIGPSSVMIERNLIHDLGGFDESLAVCEDFDLWLRITQKTAMYLANHVMIDKYAGDYEQLSRSVLSLEPSRVKALWKHKDHELAKAMIEKK